MRITDLLDARSISLQAAPGNKEEALNQAVELMTQRGNISDKAAYRRQVGERERKVQRELVKALRFHMGNVQRYLLRDWQRW